MKFSIIDNKHDLVEHRLSIGDLFYQCFGMRELGDVWDWAYLNNPGGDPIVTLCHEGDVLVGHYAMVAMPLVHNGKVVSSYISMTTMVAESHRKYGLFTQMANLTYELAMKQNIGFVFGFPNSQSVPGFRKRLNWVLPNPDYVANFEKKRLLEVAATGVLDKKGKMTFDMSDAPVRNWRLSRPGARYCFENGLVYKHHNESIDLLWWEDVSALAYVPEGRSINLLMPGDSDLGLSRQFDYQLGGMGLKSSFVPETIMREMIISDLF